MSGYIPAATQPILGWSTDPPGVKFPTAGMQITPGTGLVGRTDRAQGILSLDSAVSDPADSICMFVPGAVTGPKAVGTYRNLKRANAAYVALIETEFLTAPTADASNYVGFQVAGSVSGSVTLPSLAARNIDDFSTSAQVAHNLDPSGNIGPNINGSNQIVGMAQEFIPSSDVTITAVQWSFNNLDYVAGAGHVMRCEVMDASFNVIEAVDLTTPLPIISGYVTFNLPLSIGLTNGTHYYIGWRMVDTAAYTTPTGQRYRQAFGGSTLGGSYGFVWALGGANHVAPMTWAGAPLDPSGLNGGRNNIGVQQALRLLGGIGGTRIVGDFIVSLVNVGTGGAVAGQNMNARISVAAGN